MKDKQYYDKAISFEDLYYGLKKSCNNVRWKDSVVGYENNILKNTLKLHEDLIHGKYKISQYQKFKVYEPKERDIIATRLVDRQFQRSLCDAGLYEDITEHFILDNAACQKGKGTQFALKRLKYQMRKYYKKHGKDGYVLKCDIHHFFPETDHEIAKSMVKKYVGDVKAQKAVFNIIDSFGVQKGIGLGSEVSQLIELLMLNDLDHFIKERLRIKYYIRYMDDFILIHEDKEYLKYCLQEITAYLTKLKLQLNNKTEICKLQNGIKFLKWNFVITDTGKVLMLFDKKKLGKMRRKLRKLWIKECRGEVPYKTTYNSFTAFLANAKHGDTFYLRLNMIQFYNELTSEARYQ